MSSAKHFDRQFPFIGTSEIYRRQRHKLQLQMPQYHWLKLINLSCHCSEWKYISRWALIHHWNANKTEARPSGIPWKSTVEIIYLAMLTRVFIRTVVKLTTVIRQTGLIFFLFLKTSFRIKYFEVGIYWGKKNRQYWRYWKWISFLF